MDGGGFAGERAAAADFWRERLVRSAFYGGDGADGREAETYAPRVLFANRPCDGGPKVARRCPRPAGVAALRSAFEASGAAFENWVRWSDGNATAHAFADADVVVGPHGAGLANALLARRGLVVVEIHADFGSEQDLFRKVADARGGGFLSVRGRTGSAGGGMALTGADAAAVTACALGLWRDGSAGRRARAAAETSVATRAACGAVGPDPAGGGTRVFVGARKRLGAAPRLLEGAAVVGHDVDCASPGKPRPHYYTCPQAVDAATVASGVAGSPGPPRPTEGKKKGK